MGQNSVINEIRSKAEFLTIEELVALKDQKITIFDPFSTLISKTIQIGSNSVFHPNVRLEEARHGLLHMGDGKVFHTNTIFDANIGPITIGNNNQFGEGVVTSKTNTAEDRIVIGNDGRYRGDIVVSGNTRLGSGSQILGTITVSNCHLGDGKSYAHPIANERGGVLKGSGTADNIHLSVGEVIKGAGAFSIRVKKPQSYYHPTDV